MLPPVFAGAVVIASVLAPAGAGTTPPACPPTAVVDGPAPLARPIASILRRHGVRSGASGCAGQTVRASVSAKSDGSGYRLRVQDRFGRSNEREVDDAETAASLIESWVMDEDADLMAPRGGGPPPRPEAAATVVAPAAAASSGPTPARVRLVGLGEVASGDDGETWWGGSAGACVAVQRVCLGGRARFAHVSRAESGGFFAGGMSGDAVGAIASVELPFVRGRLQIAPRLGLGAEWTRTTGMLATLALSSDRYTLRAEGGFITTVTVARSWALVAELAASWGSPLGAAGEQGVDMFLPTPPVVAIRGGLGVGFLR